MHVEGALRCGRASLKVDFMRYTPRDAIHQGQPVASFWDSRGSGQLRLLDALGHICASIQRRREAKVTYRGPQIGRAHV